MAVSHQDIIAAARLQVHSRHPYMSYALFSLRPHPVEGLGTMAVDAKWRLYYDPEVVARWHDEAVRDAKKSPRKTHGVAAVIFHELGHVLRHHDRRRSSRDPKAWNLACVAKNTMILMSDGSEKPVQKISLGDQVVGFDGTSMTTGTVIGKSAKKRRIGVELECYGNSIVSTYDHRFLCDDGFLKLGEIIGQKGKSAQVYRIGKGFHPVQLQNKNHRGNFLPFGEAFSKRSIVHGVQRGLSTSRYYEEIKQFSLGKSFQGRASVHGWPCGRGGDCHSGQEVQLKKEQNLLPAIGYYSQYQHSSKGLAICSSLLIQSLPEQQNDGMLENEHGWAGSEEYLGVDSGIYGYQKGASGTSYRVLPTENISKFPRQAISEDGSNLRTIKEIELSNARSRRVSAQSEEFFYDLTTTCSSFVANGFIVHNCDAEINDDVIQAGWKLPDNPILPSSIGMKDGLTAEEYYQEIIKNQSALSVPSKSLVPGCGGSCGSASGNPCQREPKPDDADAPAGADEMEQEIILRKTAAAIVEHAKSRGKIPRGLQAWAEVHIEPPKIDWRRRLAGACRNAVRATAGASQSTWMKMGRRSLYSAGRPGFPMAPAYYQPVPRVGVVLDTSGSMNVQRNGDRTILEESLSETLGVTKACGAEVKVYATDAAVQAVGLVRSAKDLQKINKGGGGTVLTKGIDAADKDRHDVIVVITDGYTDVPESLPRAKLLWAVIGNPSFEALGTIIHID